jgi:hypothetical protein
MHQAQHFSKHPVFVSLPVFFRLTVLTLAFAAANISIAMGSEMDVAWCVVCAANIVFLAPDLACSLTMLLHLRIICRVLGSLRLAVLLLCCI